MAKWLSNLLEKLNPAQNEIHLDYGGNLGTTEISVNYYSAYDKIEAVRNGVDRCVNGCASFDYDVLDKIPGISATVPSIRKQKVINLLNFQPNPFQDVSRFRRLMFLDLFLDGNIFLYWDGTHLYHLPADRVEIITDPKTYVAGYKYGNTEFTAEEVIHIADNNASSIYRGVTRLKSALTSINILLNMMDFQKSFFSNSAVPGLVITSPNVLGDKMKDRLIASWQAKYNPKSGGRRPLILDGGLDVKALSDVNFRELDFENAIREKEQNILQALGVPQLLLDGGNNANITPNLRLFYLETIYPVVTMVNTALERFFGYDISPEVSKVSALQPDMRESSAYFTTLVNGGVLTPNEARAELRYPPVTDGDEIRIPANIAGSASDPSQGGKPKNPKSTDD